MSKLRVEDWILVCVLVFCTSCSVLWNVPEGYWETNPAWSADGRYIAFECYYGKPDFEGFYPESGYEICVARSDGTDYHRLTMNGREDRQPAWSPDGKRIAFVSSGFEGKVFTNKIMLVNPNGSDLAAVTEGQGPLAWSPDGQYIAYKDVAGNAAIIAVDSGKTLSLSTAGNRGDDFQPVWSPDGKLIAFTSNRDGHEEIYVTNADGTGETRLTYGTSDSTSPIWSPDGEHIAFLSLKDFQPGTGTGHWGLETMRPDGTGRTLLSHRNIDMLTWAPDGQSIIFKSAGILLKLQIDTGVETRLLDLPLYTNVKISPDGQRIVVVRRAAPSSTHTERIWIVNIDGSGELKLTQE